MFEGCFPFTARPGGNHFEETCFLLFALAPLSRVPDVMTLSSSTTHSLRPVHGNLPGVPTISHTADAKFIHSNERDRSLVHVLRNADIHARILEMCESWITTSEQPSGECSRTFARLVPSRNALRKMPRVRASRRLTFRAKNVSFVCVRSTKRIKNMKRGTR